MIIRVVRILLSLSAAMYWVVISASAGEVPPFSLAPSYDSGWQNLPFGQSHYAHDLGGDPDDYLVDVQFRTPGSHWAGHVAGFGCDYRNDEDGHLNEGIGAGLTAYDETSVTVFRMPTDSSAVQIRIRIWSSVTADLDSSWRSIDPGAADMLQHDLGGQADEYLVMLVFRGGDGIRHRFQYGGDRYLDMGSPKEAGAWWQELTSSQITVRRGATDTRVQEYRLRIWKQPRPRVDSGWISAEQSASSLFSHGLSGPWNDLSVDVMFRDSSNHLGIHHRGFGDDGYRDAGLELHESGGDWWALTGSKAEVYRCSTDETIDEVRIRVWQRPRPSFDSGWTSIDQESDVVLNHRLEGTVDSYVVQLQFYDGVPAAKMPSDLNLQHYGGDRAYDTLNEQDDREGAAWYGLDESTISVGRASHDGGADHFRLRIWRAPEADYDSGWSAIEPGEELEFFHGLGGSPDDYVVDMQMRSQGGWGVNHIGYGLDRFYDALSDSYQTTGTGWLNLTNTALTALRGADDYYYGDEVRVRIWKNTTAAWAQRLTEVNGTVSFIHNLNIEPTNLIVDVQHESSIDGYGRNHLGFGGDRTFMTASIPNGVKWRRLSRTRLSLVRSVDEANADAGVRIRIWSDVDSEPVFSDGFESGTTENWQQLP